MRVVIAAQRELGVENGDIDMVDRGRVAARFGWRIWWRKRHLHGITPGIAEAYKLYAPWVELERKNGKGERGVVLML